PTRWPLPGTCPAMWSTWPTGSSRKKAPPPTSSTTPGTPRRWSSSAASGSAEPPAHKTPPAVQTAGGLVILCRLWYATNKGAADKRQAVSPCHKEIKRSNRHSFRLVRLLLRSEEHTSELQSRFDLVCRLLLEKKQ